MNNLENGRLGEATIKAVSDKARIRIGDKKGQGLVEYGLMLVLAALVVVGLLLVSGHTVNNMIHEISEILSGSDA